MCADQRTCSISTASSTLHSSPSVSMGRRRPPRPSPQLHAVRVNQSVLHRSTRRPVNAEYQLEANSEEQKGGTGCIRRSGLAP